MLDAERMANAEAAIRKIALNNSLLLEHEYATTKADVNELMDLAHEAWYRHGGRGTRAKGRA